MPYHSIAASRVRRRARRATSSGVHVWNRPSWLWPSTPGESASSAEEKPPPGRRRSRSTYSTISSTTWRHRSVPRATAAWAYDAQQQRLVVQHLLEVRHQPLAVDRVAGETAPDVVVHPARRPSRRGSRYVEASPVTACRRAPVPGVRSAAGRASSSSGNFGARAEPTPLRGRRRWPARPRSPRPGRSRRARSSAGLEPRRARRSAWRSGVDVVASAPRGGPATPSTTAPSSCRNAGFGKYVPPKNGSPFGVRNTVIGHPPRPVIACTASM